MPSAKAAGWPGCSFQERLGQALFPPGRGATLLLQRACFGNTVLPMKTLSFKVSEEEAEEIRRQAREADLSVSEFLRRRARGESLEPVPIQVTECEFTGSMVFSGGPELPPLTTETVREWLSDFP